MTKLIFRQINKLIKQTFAEYSVLNILEDIEDSRDPAQNDFVSWCENAFLQIDVIKSEDTICVLILDLLHQQPLRSVSLMAKQWMWWPATNIFTPCLTRNWNLTSTLKCCVIKVSNAFLLLKFDIFWVAFSWWENAFLHIDVIKSEDSFSGLRVEVEEYVHCKMINFHAYVKRTNVTSQCKQWSY